MTAAEQLIEKGWKKGREEGWEEGKTALILSLIQKRFGQTSSVIEQKLRKSNPEILDQFGLSILDFKDLEDAEKWWDTVH